MSLTIIHPPLPQSIINPHNTHITYYYNTGTGSIPNREGTNTYCVHAGRTSFYETEFKKMGGELECSLTSDVDADGDDDAVDMPPTNDKCPLGQTMDDATQKCVNNPPCAPGTFSPSGNVPCLHCGLNSQAKESGSKECVPEESLVDNRPNACPAGKYSDTGTFTVTKKCTACPAGKTSSRPRGSIECTSCDSLPYFYSAESGSTYCSVCNFTEVANADHTGCINSGVNPKDEVKLVSDCHDFDNNEDKCTDRYMVPLGNGKKDWCSFCSYGPKITSERKTSCMPNSATRFYKYNAEAKNEFFECTKAETEDSNGQGGGGATPSMAPTKKGGGGGGGGSTTAPPTPKPSAAPTGKSDPYAALSGADAEKGGNAGLVVGMVFLSLFLVGMFAAAVYFRTHIEKSDTFQTVRKSVRRSLGMQEEDSTAAPAEGDTPVRKTTMIPHKSPSITMMQQQGDMGMGSMHSNPMHGTNVSGHGASVAPAAVTTAPFSSGESFEGSNPLHASNTLVKDTVPEPHAPTTAAPAASLADIEASL
jgi:hypothetical protein